MKYTVLKYNGTKFWNFCSVESKQRAMSSYWDICEQYPKEWVQLKGAKGEIICEQNNPHDNEEELGYFDDDMPNNPEEAEFYDFG